MMTACGMTACASAKDVGTQIYESLREHASSCYAPLSSGTIKTYQDWRYTNDPDFVAIPCDQDDIGTVLRHVVDIFMGTNSLIILDVCPSGQEIKNMTSEVVQLGFSARHYRLFTIVYTTTDISRKAVPREHFKASNVLHFK